MKLLAEDPSRIELERLIKEQVQGDYIYMYPPRQAYRSMDAQSLDTLIRSSLETTIAEPVNLYLHFPFCRQICSFCNLYTAPTNGRGDQFAQYVEMLAKDLRWWKPLVAGRRIETIYLGGGTPSLLAAAELDRCLEHLEEQLEFSRDDVNEVALEVAPDSVDAPKLKDFASIGITRVNLGLQTSSDEGLRQIGRRHGYSLARARIEDALCAGFDNICVDLIYGLPQQSLDDWHTTLSRVKELGPPTVCAYPLTLRPNTGFMRRGVTVQGRDQYVKYDLAREVLGSAGYEQETHVRYIVPSKGGYLQKKNHWAGQDVVGLGAGARGYLRYCDYRNGYSIVRRREALEQYKRRIQEGKHAFTEGISLSHDERMRRRVILGLLRLDLDSFTKDFDADVLAVFSDDFAELSRLGLAQVSEGILELTELGRKYRDLIVQRFFSRSVWNRISEFDYQE
jgi:oxygen-independent coproporphyrinogen-3 oxidase